MDLMNYDYSQYAKPKSEDDLAKLSNLANQQLDLERKLAEAQSTAEKVEKDLKDLAENQIPELMDSLGIEEFRKKSGLKVSVKETIRGNITKANQADAFKWLREHGHEALIKREMKVVFGMGEDADAERAAELMRDAELQAAQKASVHASTLNKFLREALEGGEDIPLELFGVFRQRSSKISV